MGIECLHMLVRFGAEVFQVFGQGLNIGRLCLCDFRLMRIERLHMLLRFGADVLQLFGQGLNIARMCLCEFRLVRIERLRPLLSFGVDPLQPFGQYLHIVLMRLCSIGLMCIERVYTLLHDQQSLVECAAHVACVTASFVELSAQRFELSTDRARMIALAHVQPVKALLQLGHASVDHGNGPGGFHTNFVETAAEILKSYAEAPAGLLQPFFQ
jgi:hypothetical protein